MSLNITYPAYIQASLSTVHPTWLPILQSGLYAMQAQDANYLVSLQNTLFMPTQNRLFAAFSMSLHDVKYVLVGEGPYPRESSATGYCFMDGAVDSLWSHQKGAGLSKAVNRATSLRNFMKMLLVADGQLSIEDTSIAAMSNIAEQALLPNSTYIQTMVDLQSQLVQRGFLLLNASLVFRPEVAPIKDAKAWEPFLQAVFAALYEENNGRKNNGKVAQKSETISLILWGKIADQLSRIHFVDDLPKLSSEHPYNLSFIANKQMQDLFRPMKLLQKF